MDINVGNVVCRHKSINNWHLFPPTVEGVSLYWPHVSSGPCKQSEQLFVLFVLMHMGLLDYYLQSLLIIWSDICPSQFAVQRVRQRSFMINKSLPRSSRVSPGLLETTWTVDLVVSVKDGYWTADRKPTDKTELVGRRGLVVVVHRTAGGHLLIKSLPYCVRAISSLPIIFLCWMLYWLLPDKITARLQAVISLWWAPWLLVAL